MKEMNIGYLADGDLLVYNDRDVEFKHNSNAVFADAKMVTNTPPCYKGPMRPMEYKRGGYEVFVVRECDYYTIKVYVQEPTPVGKEYHADTELVLHEYINESIDKYEQLWSTEAISRYDIYKHVDGNDVKVTTDDIYKEQVLDNSGIPIGQVRTK